jgi:CDP-diglyceride synthetase
VCRARVCHGPGMGTPPRHSPAAGPFGEKAFRGALLGCVVSVLAGALMMLLGREAARAAGTALLVLGIVGLLTSAAGLLLERHVRRRERP